MPPPSLAADHEDTDEAYKDPNQLAPADQQATLGAEINDSLRPEVLPKLPPATRNRLIGHELMIEVAKHQPEATNEIVGIMIVLGNCLLLSLLE